MENKTRLSEFKDEVSWIGDRNVAYLSIGKDLPIIIVNVPSIIHYRWLFTSHIFITNGPYWAS